MYEARDFRSTFSLSWIFQEFHSLWYFFARYRKSMMVHIGAKYARRSFNVKATKESLTLPVVCRRLWFLIAPTLILLFAYPHIGIRFFRALCLRLTASILPYHSCKLRKVLFGRRMILFKSRRLLLDRIWAFTYKIENKRSK